MEKKKIVILIMALLILIGILIFSIINSPKISGGVVENHYTYTKAVCNRTNYCQDYEITCLNNDVVSMKPIGAVIRFPDNWKDSRNEKTIKKIC